MKHSSSSHSGGSKKLLRSTRHKKSWFGRSCSIQRIGLWIILFSVIGYFGLLWSTLSTWAETVKEDEHVVSSPSSTQHQNPKRQPIVDSSIQEKRKGKKYAGGQFKSIAEYSDFYKQKLQGKPFERISNVTSLFQELSKQRQQGQQQNWQPQQLFQKTFHETIMQQHPDIQNDPIDDSLIVDERTIGIASTITNCGPDPFTEGAAVLKYSIDLTSADYVGKNKKGGTYKYKYYILYHPDALQCVLPLQDLGFTLLERPTPVNVSDIQGDILRERITKNGCCGERELIKLEAYRLTQHKVVIHLDLDVLVMKPMDPIIDFILDPIHNYDPNKVSLMWPYRPIPKDVQLLFTKDYNVVMPKRKDKPFQGGFFVIKPSLDAYDLMVKTVLEGDYRDSKKEGKGWGGVVGPFHGGMTIQGLLPWFYEHLVPGFAVELHRCVYNNIADNPTTQRTVKDIPMGKCRTNEEKCEDCRARNISDIVVFHYCTCFKPWTCVPQKQNRIQMRLCRRTHHEWFKYRRNLEISWGRNGTSWGTLQPDHFLGFCNSTYSPGYIPIQTPYGKPI